MRNKIAPITCLILLAGCAATDIVYLKDAKGSMAHCGPFDKRGVAGPVAAAQQESQCISDFHRQGYERVSQ